MVEEATGEQYMYDASDLGDLSVRVHGFLYKFNLCDAVTSGCNDKCAICRQYTNGNNNETDDQFTCLGKITSRDVAPYGFVPPQPGIGFVAMFGDGDSCDDSKNDNYACSVIVLCDPDQKALIAVTQEEDCYVEISVSSKAGCGFLPTSSQLNSDSAETDAGEIAALVILILMIVCLVLYFALGAVYQKKTQDPGTLREYIIHNEFWCSLPSLVVDGCKFIAHGCKKGDYLSV